MVLDLPEQAGVLRRNGTFVDREPALVEQRSRGLLDRHEIRVDVELLEGREEERLVPHDRAPSVAPLVLAERRLVEVNRIAEDVELLEVLLRVERVVAEIVEGVAVQAVGSALRDDVDDAAGRLAELRGVGVGQDLELADRFLAEARAHGADDLVVVVEAVHHDVVRASPLAGERQARRGRRTLLRRPIGRRRA